MNIYIATKFENDYAFHETEKLLKAQGHTIAHDWTKESVGERQGPELYTYLQRCAYRDLKGVEFADALLFLPYAEKPMVGAYVELGFAIAQRKRIIAIDAFNPKFQNNIFWHYSGIEHYKTLNDALASL